MTRRMRNRLAALLCPALSCITAGTAWSGTLQGTALYRERIALPPSAVFEATLEDIARADAPAVVLGRAYLDPAGPPPYEFEITYDDAAVQPRGRYAMRATIRDRGRLLFTTDRVYPVLDGRNAPLELLLVSVQRTPPSAAKPDGIGTLGSSFEGELAGAGNPSAGTRTCFRKAASSNASRCLLTRRPRSSLRCDPSRLPQVP